MYLDKCHLSRPFWQEFPFFASFAVLLETLQTDCRTRN